MPEEKTEEKTEVLRRASINPKLDWICDGCGKKIYGRRKVPAGRCHGYPLRPMGSPWKYATEAFYERYPAGTGKGGKLPDDYWISDQVIARLTEVVAERVGPALIIAADTLCALDGRIIGKGDVGPITRQLTGAFHTLVRNEK